MAPTTLLRYTLLSFTLVSLTVSQGCLPGCTCRFDQAHMVCRGINLQVPSTIPAGIKDVEFLNCYFKNLPKLPANYSECESLTIMNSKVSTIADGAFEQLSKVHTLNLHGNQIQRIDSSVFRGMTSLRQLSLQANKITTFEEYSFHDNPNIEVLTLSDNHNLELQSKSFAQPENVTNKLNYIELHNCGLTTVPTSSICHSKLPGLTHLDLSGNDFRNLSESLFKHAPNLRFLNLDSCQVSGIQRETLGALTNLETLLLSNNLITSIDEQAFDDFYTSMKYLHLEYNQLTSVDDHMFNFNVLTVLNVSYNPWDCSCENSWLQVFPVKPNNTHHNITCDTPKEYHGKNALTVMTKDVKDCSSDYADPMVAVYVAIPILIILAIVTIIIIVKICRLKRKEKRRNSAQYSLVYKPTTEHA